MDYRPLSPDLSGYVPKSPDLSALSAFDAYGQPQQHPQLQQHSRAQYGGPSANGFDPTSLEPPLHTQNFPLQQQQQFLHPHFQQPFDPNFQPPPQFGLPIKHEDQDYAPTTPQARPRRGRPPGSNAPQAMSSAPPQKGDFPDPTYGVELKTSFPVARIKRIMQADEDIGKVAQVTPHVVSRALELFMIKLISASAAQAQGGAAGAAGGAKAQKRVLSQHLKQVIMTDDNFDFLREIVGKVPDAPSKAKKEANSDSEESKPAKKPRGKKRKDSGDEF